MRGGGVLQCACVVECKSLCSSATAKPRPLFLSPGSTVQLLVYGCQKPWPLLWQYHTAIFCAGCLLLQPLIERKREKKRWKKEGRQGGRKEREGRREGECKGSSFIL